jgi:Zn-dependent protease/CBS domain-containing protein
MKWSLRIARVAGIDVYVHATFLILLAWIGLSFWNQEGSLAATLVGMAFIVTIFGCVLLHELGHALAARRFGIRTRDITLLPIGGVARLERMPDKPLQELWVAIAGPLVNVGIAAVLFVAIALTERWAPVAQISVAEGSFLQTLLFVNLILIVFNMIPAFPMDGGRVLRAILALRLDYTLATQIAASIGQAIALLFGLFALLGPLFLPNMIFNPFLVIIALFVWIGAAQEASMTQMKSALSGIPAASAMQTHFHTVSPDDRLSSVLQLVLAGSQTDFPVETDGKLVGILTRADLLATVAARGVDVSVGEVMQREFQTADPHEMLEVAFARLQACQCHTLPVVRAGRLVGLLSTDNVGEFLMIQSALARRNAGRSPGRGAT